MLQLPNIEDTKDPVIKKLIRAVQELADHIGTVNTELYQILIDNQLQTNERFQSLETALKQRFASLENTTNQRFASLENRVGNLENKMDTQTEVLRQLENKMDTQTEELRQLENKMDTQTDLLRQRVGNLENKMDTQTDLLRQIAHNTKPPAPTKKKA